MGSLIKDNARHGKLEVRKKLKKVIKLNITIHNRINLKIINKISKKVQNVQRNLTEILGIGHRIMIRNIEYTKIDLKYQFVIILDFA